MNDKLIKILTNFQRLHAEIENHYFVLRTQEPVDKVLRGAQAWCFNT